MRKVLFLLFVFALIGHVTAQNFKFGKVSKQEIEASSHQLEPDASAAVLYKKEDISFVYSSSTGFTQEREVIERIKIYNKEGFEWATKKIYLYEDPSGSREKTRGIKGYTYNLENGKIVKEKLTKDGIFRDDFNEFTEINTVTMPNIKEGSVIEFKYTIVSPFITIDDIIFQYDIPIDKLELRVATPDFFRYKNNLNFKSVFMPKINTSSLDKKGMQTTRNRDKMEGNRNFSAQGYSYKENILTVEEDNIPALVAEPYSGAINNYRSKLSMEYTARANSIGAIEKSYATTWEQVSKSIYNSPDFGNQINRSGFFKDEITPLLNGVTNNFQKAFVLQSYVKNKVRWNGLNGVFAQNGTREAFKSGEGNVADINLLLIAMLQSQGVNALPVLVSTRNHGIPLFPTRRGFNYVVALVKEGDNYALLDATEIYSTINILPERVINWQGRLIEKDGSSQWISLQPQSLAVKSTVLNVSINDDLSISGKVRQNMTEHMAMEYRIERTGITLEDHVKSIENGKGDIEISELLFENEKDITQPVKISYNYKSYDEIDDVGSSILIKPLVFLAEDENPFKLDRRTYPIDFVKPFEYKYMVNIKLPEGFTVEVLPDTNKYIFKDGLGSFVYMAKQNGQYLQFTLDLKVSTSIISPQDYLAFKDFYGSVIKKQQEQVVLSKVDK